MYWEKEIETMDRGNLEKLQAARLGETLGRARQAAGGTRTRSVRSGGCRRP